MTGRVHSLQSLGTVDGPGVRFVVFLQGCPLRCKCCHNPDTWDTKAGNKYSAEEIVAKALRYREYFGKDGGITLSGGEPLLQADFCREIFRLCRSEGINTCLDTSGCIMSDEVKKLLSETDRVLLDIKYLTDSQYRENVGCSIDGPLRFLEYLNETGIPTTVRQVMIPTLNDTVENVKALKELTRRHPCVDKIELLPLKKLCLSKYEEMGIAFPLSHIPEPSKEHMAELDRALLEE